MTDNNIELHLGDNLKILKEIKKNSIDLIYIDPPYNTGGDANTFKYNNT